MGRPTGAQRRGTRRQRRPTGTERRPEPAALPAVSSAEDLARAWSKARAFMQRAAGVVQGEDQVYLLEARVGPLARARRSSIAGYVGDACAAPLSSELQLELLDALTTHETFFFRDAPFWLALQEAVLPAAVAAAGGRPLRIWCAACSTGQEPYTLAMTLKETPALAGWKIEFVATDLSADVLARARDGRYTQLEVNRGLPAPLLVKYFEKSGIEWRVRKELRDMIRFTELNLTERFPPLPACDLVFMRNVLIYFDVQTKRGILEAVKKVLRPDGYLFLGGAETTLNVHDGYERQAIERTSCYRLRKA